MKGNKVFMLFALMLLFVSFLAVAPFASADETIFDFHSDIVVHEDASVTVTETIAVRAEGDKIKHGIYRDFPTRYKDGRGARYTVRFEVAGVLKNGSAEPYHITDEGNGRRVYIGDKDTLIPPGDYIYTIIYRTNRQLGFFGDHDELYWNVTGNGWDFPIETASVSVQLPGAAGSRVTETDAYTGPQGAKGKDFRKGVDPSGRITFSTTRGLAPREGLTIVVSWPKGFVREPLASEKMGYFLSDNRGIIFGAVGLCAILLYYLIAWWRAGRDPEAGTIMTRYEPPANITPAMMRYITKMEYDDRVFASAVIDMAVKGFLEITEEQGTYSVKRKEGKVPLSPDEDRIGKMLLGQDGGIVLEQSNHQTIRTAITGLKNYLSGACDKVYFITNLRYFVAGVILTALTLVGTGFWESAARGSLPIFLFICFWLSGWSLGVALLLKQVVMRWRAALREGVVSGAGALFLTFFAVPFVAGEVGGIVVMAYATSIATMVFLFIGVMINYLFHHLLKAPTRAGRSVLDQIEGFKVFLAATEKERMNRMVPPERTPNLFEKYLPYALALGVEQEWAEQFSGVLASAATGTDGYAPTWYSGTSFRSMTPGAFASSFGDAFGGAVASASTAPGSSSGGGGGGSSGGGGGGGGGGGW